MSKSLDAMKQTLTTNIEDSKTLLKDVKKETTQAIKKLDQTKASVAKVTQQAAKPAPKPVPKPVAKGPVQHVKKPSLRESIRKTTAKVEQKAHKAEAPKVSVQPDRAEITLNIQVTTAPPHWEKPVSHMTVEKTHSGAIPEVNRTNEGGLTPMSFHPSSVATDKTKEDKIERTSKSSNFSGFGGVNQGFSKN